MNVLTLCYEFPPIGGGGARVVSGLSRQLSGKGHRLDLVTMGCQGLTATERIDGITVHRVPCWRRRRFVCSAAEASSYVWPAFQAARRLAARTRYDLIHAHFIFPDGLIARWISHRTGIPYLITAHGSDVPGYNPHRLTGLHRLLAPVWRRVVRDAACVICPSRTLDVLVQAAAPDAQTTIIPNGFDAGTFNGSGRRVNRILVVSRLLRRKGVQYVLEALQTVPLNGYEVQVVGDGPYLAVLQERAAAAKLPVRFRGWLEHGSLELRELYETSRIFLLPSEAENFPVSLLEAMAAGLAIVTTAGTGCAEVVGDAARLVPVRDAEAIAAQLRTLMHDPAQCEALGRTARRRVSEQFGWAAVAAQYEAEYRRHGR